MLTLTRRLFSRPRAIAALLFWLAALGSFEPRLSEASNGDDAGERVLFIGNSLTATNDLPLVVEAMAQSLSIPLSCEAVTHPGASLEDHWRLGTVNSIRAGGWSYVVLQQGPSSLLSSRENLREWTKRFAEEIRAVGAVPALFMVWPDRSRIAFFPQVRESYRLASVDVLGLFLGAGEAWETAWRRDRKLDLYGADQFHPSRLGTFAAAAAIFTGLTGRSAEDIPLRLKLRNGVEYRVDARRGALVLAAVSEMHSQRRP